MYDRLVKETERVELVESGKKSFYVVNGRFTIHQPDPHTKYKEIKADTSKEAKQKAKEKGWLKEAVQDEAWLSKLSSVAELQRGAPEAAMRELSNESENYENQASPLYASLAMHVGDLMHRMFEEPIPFFKGAYALDKIEKTLRWLQELYGFKREVDEQIAHNFEYYQKQGKLEGMTFEQFKSNFMAKCQAFADAHKKLPAYNEAQQMAKDASIAVGEWRFNDAIRILKNLQSKGDDPDEWYDFLTAKPTGEQNV